MPIGPTTHATLDANENIDDVAPDIGGLTIEKVEGKNAVLVTATPPTTDFNGDPVENVTAFKGLLTSLPGDNVHVMANDEAAVLEADPSARAVSIPQVKGGEAESLETHWPPRTPATVIGHWTDEAE